MALSLKYLTLTTLRKDIVFDKMIISNIIPNMDSRILFKYGLNKNSPYSQIEDSLCKEGKAFDLYRGKLDYIYLYK
ncbi:hypothetical protein B5S50_20110 [Clostridium sp. 001]|uniref:Uncharacterized protein n=1 Tax=Clostridium ragsdalei P11 TaxID=1353534 RepID=A0A1A6AVL7_9CLOT|nr:hypothetical protein CLRAG_16710 [Clostridium ragsdalei P11]QXE20969.1 hypothetical protein B5S50_20110 [Clostridium sp. 001]